METDLNRFLELYRSFGIEPTLCDHDDAYSGTGNVIYRIDANEKNTHGYGGGSILL